jgi:hypothetical protein
MVLGRWDLTSAAKVEKKFKQGLNCIAKGDRSEKMKGMGCCGFPQIYGN